MSKDTSLGSTHAPSVSQTDLLTHISLLQEALDAAAPTEAALIRAERQITALQDQVERLSAQIAEGHHHSEALEQEIARLHGSLSLRLTAPLRTLRRLLSRSS